MAHPPIPDVQTPAAPNRLERMLKAIQGQPGLDSFEPQRSALDILLTPPRVQTEDDVLDVLRASIGLPGTAGIARAITGVAKGAGRVPAGTLAANVPPKDTSSPFIGFITKDGKKSEFFDEAAAANADFHHTFLIKDLDAFDTPGTLRFVRNGGGPDFTISGQAAIDPLKKESTEEIARLARTLIEKGADPKAPLRIENMALPRSEARFQGQAIGTLEEWAGKSKVGEVKDLVGPRMKQLMKELGSADEEVRILSGQDSVLATGLDTIDDAQATLKSAKNSKFDRLTQKRIEKSLAELDVEDPFSGKMRNLKGFNEEDLLEFRRQLRLTDQGLQLQRVDAEKNLSRLEQLLKALEKGPK